MARRTVCLVCGGSGTVPRGAPGLSQQEVNQMALSMVTIALEHRISGDDEAATSDELRAVLGDAPISDVPVVLAVVAAIGAYLVEGFSQLSGDDPREYWERIAQHILREDG
jgi:hypothetical protein